MEEWNSVLRDVVTPMSVITVAARSKGGIKVQLLWNLRGRRLFCEVLAYLRISMAPGLISSKNFVRPTPLFREWSVWSEMHMCAA